MIKKGPEKIIKAEKLKNRIRKLHVFGASPFELKNKQVQVARNNI